MAELLEHRDSKAYVERLAAALVEAAARIDAADLVEANGSSSRKAFEIAERPRSRHGVARR